MERAAETCVNRQEEEEMEISGHSPCCWKLALVSLGTVCSGGLLLLLLYWLPELSVKWTCRAVPLQEAWAVLLRTTDEFRTWSRVRVHSFLAPGSQPLGFPQWSESKRPPCPASPPEDWGCREGPLAQPASGEQAEARFFVHRHVRYLWDGASQSFRRLTALDRGLPCAALHTQHGTGLPRDTQDYRRLFYGANQIDVKVPSIPRLLIQEVLNPFYIFQAFSMLLWSLDDYYLYASAILFMSLVSIGCSLYTLRKQYVLLHDTVATHNVVRVTVYRGPHGFSTSKGQLVRAILFPKPTDFRLYRDACRFLLPIVPLPAGSCGQPFLLVQLPPGRAGPPCPRAVWLPLDRRHGCLPLSPRLEGIFQGTPWTSSCWRPLDGFWKSPHRRRRLCMTKSSPLSCILRTRSCLRSRREHLRTSQGSQRC